MILELLYHVCPLRSNDVWMANIDQIIARLKIFNGRRVVAIATGSDSLLHPPERVIQMFRGNLGVSFLSVPNDRNLREVASFRPLLDSVSDRPWNDRFVFYAHTKGNSTADNAEGATYWRNVMYHELLDKWQRCVTLMREPRISERGVRDLPYAMVGTHQMCWDKNQKCPYPSRLAHGTWMFAGTFWWFSAAQVYTHPRWKFVPLDRYGAEAWPSGLFHPTDVKSVWQPVPPDKFYGRDPYSPELYYRENACIADIELKHPSYQI